MTTQDNLSTGSWSTGSYNRGDSNSGDHNTGFYNTGSRNTGSWNTGDHNTGFYNTGSRNTGSWNTGDGNTGYFNTVTPSTILVFNKPLQRSEWEKADIPQWMFCRLTKWVRRDQMSDKEKETHPSYTTTGGYLKVYPSLQHAYIEAWEGADEADREKTFKLPNFDVEVFEEIFGFRPLKKQAVEMTVAEIAAKLGHDIKIVE